MGERCTIASRESVWETYDASPLTADNGGNRITAPLALSHTRFPMQELGNAISVRLKYPAGATITQDVRVQLFGLTQDDSPSWLYDELNNDHEIVLRTSPTEDVTDGTWKWTLHTRLFTKGNAKIIVGIMRALEGSGLTGAAIELKISSIYAQPYVPRRWPLLLLGRQRTERYLFRDTFNNGAVAGYADDAVRTCSPGPGTITIEGNKFSVASNKLSWTAGTGSFTNHYCTGSVGVTRESGRMMLGKLTVSGSQNVIIWGFWPSSPATGSTNSHAFYTPNTPTLAIREDNQNIAFLEALSTGVEYELAIVLRSAGAFYFIRGGTYTNWTLLFVSDKNNDATNYPGLNNFAQAGTLDDWRIARRLWTPATSLSIATPSDGQVFPITESNFIADIAVSRNGTSGSAQYLFRVLDEDNYYYLSISGTNGSASVSKVVGGSLTANLITFASGTLANPGTLTFRIIAYGSTIRAYSHTAASTTWTQGTSSPYTDASDLSAATGMEYTQTGVVVTTSSLNVWKRTWNEGFPSV